MRGRNIIWLSLIAVLIGSMTVNLGASAASTKLYLDPYTIPGPGLLGQIGEAYTISVKVDDVSDLWGAGFEIHIAPYVSVLTISQIYEGPFLGAGWYKTDFSYTVDLFSGIAYVAIVRLPYPDPTIPREGAFGSGVLATFKLTVIEAGECPIEIVDDYLLDSNGKPISHKTTDGYYKGSTGYLIRTNMLPGRVVSVGETATFNAKVRNDGDIPLYVMVRYDISRMEDARKIVIRSGQTYIGGGFGEPRPYEYIYVDEFDEWYYEWIGAPENLFGEPDGAYIESDTNAAWACMYSFEPIVDALGLPIADIFLEGYTQYPNGATDAVDIDMYDISPGQGYPFAWWGSLFGTTSWAWQVPRWTTDSVLTSSPWLADKAALNDVWILAYNYHGSATDIMRVDSLRLRVEYNPFYIEGDASVVLLMPGEELVLDPFTWTAKLDHVGSYEATATIEYTSEGLKWNSWGAKQKTFSFSIIP